MTLEEAIKHCEEKAEELKKRAEEVAMNDAEGVYQPQVGRCIECASDHEQLAEWLIELKKYREKDRYNNYDVCLGGFHDD